VQSRVGNNLWQVDPSFRVHFFYFISKVLLYVPSGMSKFDFGPEFLHEIL
jgi:hypothetical protein